MISFQRNKQPSMVTFFSILKASIVTPFSSSEPQTRERVRSTKPLCVRPITKPARISTKVSTYNESGKVYVHIDAFDGCQTNCFTEHLVEIKSYSLLSVEKPHLTPKYEKISSKVSSYKILDSGMIQFNHYLSLKAQVDIVNLFEKWHMDSRGFYWPRYRNGVKYRFETMCFGRNWDPQTRYNKSDGFEPLLVPHELVSLPLLQLKMRRARLRAQAYLDETPHQASF
ncbi:hypothetical protein QVD17_10804 [Tagetes erecta]|uniref:Uncharacterized protein n=1 Tax=Tagetes erecta TaxID=13708 RepID=A0AAD8L717_TARER|nr:hypothetical protein QVD17_10804 [Tagetes erecta]